MANPPLGGEPAWASSPSRDVAQPHHPPTSPVFRSIDDPAVDQTDCRLAVAHIGERVVSGEPREPLFAKADRWLDLFAVLELRDEMHRYGRS